MVRPENQRRGTSMTVSQSDKDSIPRAASAQGASSSPMLGWRLGAHDGDVVSRRWQPPPRVAGTLGRRDGKVTRDEAMHRRDNLRRHRAACPPTLKKASATSPRSLPNDQAGRRRRLGGCSIEDATGNPDAPSSTLLRDGTHHGRRRRGARLAVPVTLTGRTENFCADGSTGRHNQAVQTYEAAGVDALMAPGLPTRRGARVCAALTKPFNFMVGIKGKSFTVAALQAPGETHQSRHVAVSRGDDRLHAAAQEVGRTAPSATSTARSRPPT